MRIYAHRGASAERPENTLPAFRRALDLGADAFELDVHLTRDGHVVVSHDPGGARMAGVPRAIAASTLAEVRSWDLGRGFRAPDGGRPFAGTGVRMPLLEEVLAELPGVPVNVDLKAESAALVDAFVALVRARRDEDRVIAASFHHRNLVRLRRRGWAGETALARREVLELLALPAALWARLPYRGSAAQLPARLGPLRAPLARRCKAAGLRVDFWTVNDPAEARALAALGADGIMTDDPARVVPALRVSEPAAILRG
jgi:glycerophosphoryl diester phosphodiesterase